MTDSHMSVNEKKKYRKGEGKPKTKSKDATSYQIPADFLDCDIRKKKLKAVDVSFRSCHY